MDEGLSKVFAGIAYGVTMGTGMAIASSAGASAILGGILSMGLATMAQDSVLKDASGGERIYGAMLGVFIALATYAATDEAKTTFCRSPEPSLKEWQTTLNCAPSAPKLSIPKP